MQATGAINLVLKASLVQTHTGLKRLQN